MAISEHKITNPAIFSELLDIGKNLGQEDTYLFIKIVYGVLLNSYTSPGLKRREYFELKSEVHSFAYLDSIFANCDHLLPNITEMIRNVVKGGKSLLKCKTGKKFARVIRRSIRNNSMFNAGIPLRNMHMVNSVSYNAQLKKLFEIGKYEVPHNMLNKFLFAFGCLSETLSVLNKLISNHRSVFFKRRLSTKCKIMEPMKELFGIVFSPEVEESV
jgi:hypothetical protein